MADPARIHVLIVAAYPAIRAGLISLLTADPLLEPLALEPVGFRGDGSLAAPSPAASDPTVLVIDLSGTDDAALEEVRDAHPDAGTVLIGGDPNLDGPGIAEGAVAYLGPDVDGPMLIAAVHGVAAGLTVIDPVIAGAWLRQAPAPDPGGAGIALVGSPDILTDRERQVLELVATGLPNKAIARELGISEHTVKFHVGSLLGKLGAGSRTEAVTLATRRGLLTI